MARSRRYSRSLLGHNSGSTQNVCVRILSDTPHNVLILFTAVVLANVLGFFDPIRTLIQSAINDGFIRPAAINLVKFVDGPSDHSLHESFDWGEALLEELDSWRDHPSYKVGFDWTRPKEIGGERTEAIYAT